MMKSVCSSILTKRSSCSRAKTELVLNVLSPILGVGSVPVNPTSLSPSALDRVAPGDGTNGRVPPHSVVVGAGAVGLTVAFRLRQAGHRVTILERAPVVGGLTAAHTVGPVTWDRHYHVTLASDSAWRAVLVDLGLDDQIVWKTTRTACLADGKLLPVSSPAEFLRFTPLSLVQRLRLGATLAWATQVRDGYKMEQIPVERWLRRLSGNSAFDRFWVPLLRAKLGDAYPSASAAFIWATAQRLGKARKNGLDAEKFGYVPGGYAHVLDVFAQRLRADGVEIRTGVEIAEVAAGSVTLRSGEQASGSEQAVPDEVLRADHVVITASAKTAASLVPSLTGAEQALLAQVQYQGVIDVSLVLTKPLCPFYLTYLLDETPLTGVVDMSSLVEADQVGGHGLVYLPRYCSADDPLFAEPDEAVIAKFTSALAAVYPSFDPSTVIAAKVARAREVFSIPTLGYSDRVMPSRTSVPGVWVANSSQIVHGTLNVDESVQLAERVVRELLHDQRVDEMKNGRTMSPAAA
jgi:protoporphyrinogen oxidase